MADQFIHGIEIAEIDIGPRAIRTVRSGVIGLVGTAPDADTVAFPLDTPVLIAGSRREAAALDMQGGGAGTLPAAVDAIFDQAGAMIVVVRVENGASESDTLARIIGGVEAESGHYKGIQALLGAESVVGVKPRILIAPGFTGSRREDPDDPGQALADPVVAALIPIAEQLRAVIVADGPNTHDSDAIAYANDFGVRRVYTVDPGVRVMNGDGAIIQQPASARVAGRIAWTDANRGFWWSPSNTPINGIVGTARAVSFALGDTHSRANLLNEARVATIIRQNGFRLWGNRTLSADPKWAFLNVVRTADMIHESLQQAHLWAVDRNLTRQYMEDVTEGVNNYLRTLKARGAILGGRCWPDPDLNTPSELQQGRVYFNFDFTPPAPAEHITFRSHLVNDYYEEVL